MLRFKKFLNQVNKAERHFSKIVKAGDYNIDTSEDNDTMGRYGVKDLLEDYVKFQEDKNFCIMNCEPTRYQSYCSPSLIDHILTNAPNYIENIDITRNIISIHPSIHPLIH